MEVKFGMIDVIFKTDDEFVLKKIIPIDEFKSWFENSIWNDRIGKKIDNVLDTCINPNGGIVEIQNTFFKYQIINEGNGYSLYFSRDGILLDFYEQTIKQVAEGIQIYDRNGYFLYANPASEILEYYKKDDFKRRHLLDIYDVKEEYSTVLTVLRTQQAVSNRCDRFKMRNGNILTTINSGYPLKIDGNLYGAVVFESDLSVLKSIKNRTLNLENYIESKQPEIENHLYTFEDIIHSSENMKDVIHFAKKVSLTDSSILIVGTTGTGKELIAQSIHSFSPRRHKAFIDINCGAIPSNLFESMFFGTEKGAFTGSIAKKGFFEMANGGTLFLDEVNSIGIDMQAKLLRVLQEKRFRRIGGSEYIKCDVRIITASNEDLFELMHQQKIRKDFYYRISTIKIDVPSLKDRKEDIPILSKHFLQQLCKEYNRKQMNIDEKVFDTLLIYDWPGNIRELQNVIEYAFNHAQEDEIILEFDNLPDYLRSSKFVSHKMTKSTNEKSFSLINSGTFEERMERVEREIIIETLELNRGNITQSAKVLGMSRQSLQYRMKKLGICDR